MLTLNILCSRLKAILCAGEGKREVDKKHQISNLTHCHCPDIHHSTSSPIVVS